MFIVSTAFPLKRQIMLLGYNMFHKPEHFGLENPSSKLQESRAHALFSQFCQIEKETFAAFWSPVVHCMT